MSQASYFEKAFEEAQAAAQRGEVPVGAVVVSSGSIVSQAGNRMRELSDPTAHAEILAIRHACKSVQSDRIPEMDLYVTLEPCTLCASAISFARIRRLYFSAYDRKAGAVEHGVCFFNQATCHHAPEVYGGFQEERSLIMLKTFFLELREHNT